MIDVEALCAAFLNWYWLADACSDAGIEFVLGHALYLKHIHGGKNKNDKIDSAKLAHLLRTNLIPPSYVYPRERRPMRGLLRQRMSYVWERSTLLGHLQMNQQSEGYNPVAKGGHNRDVWEERILSQYSEPLHRFSDGDSYYRIQVKTVDDKGNGKMRTVQKMWKDENSIDVIVYFVRNSDWGVVAPAFSEEERCLNHPEHIQFKKFSQKQFLTAFHSVPNR